MAKTKVGKMKCESCGEPVTVRTNERETLSYRCEECDAAPYARPGTGLHGIWMGKITLDKSPSAAPAKTPDPQPTPPPPPEKSDSNSDNGNLWGFK